MHYQAIIATPLPRVHLGLQVRNGALVALDFLDESQRLRAPEDHTTQNAADQLARYFIAPDMVFTCALAPRGTPYQQRVWTTLRAIPPGQTLNYGALAAKLGSGARAVGAACRANPLPIIIPCHRVVATSGLGGYSGAWDDGPELRIKAWLLAHERHGS